MPRALGKSVRLKLAGGLPAGRSVAIALLAAMTAGATGSTVRAAETPLLSRPASEGGSARPELRTLVAAVESAVEAGLPTLAENLGSDALAKPGLDAAGRRRVRLALASARIQRAAYDEASAILREIPGEDADKNLRLGLAAYGTGRFGDARRHLDSALRGTLSAHDILWRDVLAGLLAAEAGQENAAVQNFKSAAEKSRDPLTAAQVGLLRRRMEMRLRPPGSDPIDDLGKLVEILPDSRQTFQLAKTQSFALYRARKYDDAAFHLARIPVADADLIAQRDLLFGLMIGGEELGAGGRRVDGRAALLRAAAAEGFPEIQTAALAALREAVLKAPTGEMLKNANVVYAALTEPGFARRMAASSVADFLLYTRAQILLTAAARADSTADRDSARTKADDALRELLEKFPASPLRADALALTADLAWQSGAYRMAADALDKLRPLLSASDKDAAGLVAADCYFLYGDFANAAAGYAEARKKLPDEAGRGEAFIGEIRSLLADKKIAESEKAFVAASTPGARIPADALRRADWLISDELRRAGDTARALDRVRRALAASPAPDAGIRVRFLWLRAMLELASKQNREAAATAGELARLVEKPTPDTPAEIRDNNNASAILAQAALLKAHALLGAGGATESFRELREKFPKQPSAAASYLIEGRHLASTGDHVKAMETFKKGFDIYGDESDPRLVECAAASLFEAANEALALAESRGRDAFDKALKLFDQFTKKFPPPNPLYFRACLTQGDILRRLNEFDSALKVYEDLITLQPAHHDRLLADLAKANCLYELGASDNKRAELIVRAAAEYDRLVNLPDRPADLAAEAAYKRAETVSKSPTKGAPDTTTGERLARTEAAKGLLLWIVDTLGTPAQAASLGDNGRYWIARGFILVAELRAKDGNLVEARAALKRLLDYNAGLKPGEHRLPGANLARQRLDQLSGSAETTPFTPKS